MKKFNALKYLIIPGLLIILLVAWPALASNESSDITVTIDGLQLETDVAPVIVNNRTMVPIRAVSEALGLQVGWVPEQKTVVVTGEELVVEMTIGNSTATVNGIPYSLDSAPVIVSGRTLVPLRFVSERFGCSVAWDAGLRQVSILTPPKDMEVTCYYALGDTATSSWEDLFEAPYPEKKTGNTDLMNTVALGWYSLDENGSLLTRSTTGWQRPQGWEDVVEAARQYDLRTEMVVHMTDSNARIISLLRSNSACDEAVRQIAHEAGQYDAVNLDLEGLGWKDTPEEQKRVQGEFTRFIEELAAELGQSGIELTLSLHPLNSAYKGYDYDALGKAADRIIVMAYDYGGNPEPADKVLEAVQLAAAVVPADKLILGISLPNENTASLPTKIGIAKRYQLKGIALWRLGLVSDEMWDELHRNIVARR